MTTKDHRTDDRQIPETLLVAAGWAWRLLLLALATYAVLRLLGMMTLVVVPVVAAVLLTALLRPLVTLLRRRLPGAAAALVTLFTAVAALGGVGYGIGLRVAEQWGDLVDRAVASVARLRAAVGGSAGLEEDLLNQGQQLVTRWAADQRGRLAEYLSTGAGYVFEFLAGFALTLFVAFFLLYDGQRIWNWLLAPLPDRAELRVHAAGTAAWDTLSAYLRGTAAIAMMHTIVIGLVLVALGVPLALPLAALVFLGSFIPIVGALAAGGLSVLITLGTLGWVKALILLAVLVAEDQLEANVLQPMIMGRYLRLHPLAIGLSLAVGSVLHGILGAIIAVPVTAILYRSVPVLLTADE